MPAGFSASRVDLRGTGVKRVHYHTLVQVQVADVRISKCLNVNTVMAIIGEGTRIIL